MSMSGYRPVPVVPYGPRAFRFQIRRLGPVAAMLPALLLGAAAVALLHHNATTARGVAGFAAAVLAAPAMMAAGVPLATGAHRAVIGIAISVVLWFLIGVIAARRATRSPVATWRDFWREYAWLAIAVWLGVGAALVIVEVTVGRGLL
ncbi:MAG TPA: hypothetical protein VGM78_14065 [Ilumatobacteraceae bacterium]